MISLQGYGGMLFQGFLTTVWLAVCSLGVAIILGMLGVRAKLSPHGVIRSLADFYTTVVRGIPDLVLMLLIFYGGQIAVNTLLETVSSDLYVDINPLIAGVTTIGFIFGAYMTETFRGAIQSIPEGQKEAALALGLSRYKVFWFVQLPQMIRFALPGIGNNWLVLIKATAIVSIIGLEDVVRKASLAAGATRQPFTFYVVAAGYYLVLTAMSGFIFHRLEIGFERRWPASVK